MAVGIARIVESITREVAQDFIQALSQGRPGHAAPYFLMIAYLTHNTLPRSFSLWICFMAITPF